MKIVDKIVLQDIKPHIRGLIGILGLTFIGIGLEALAPWPFKFLLDNVLENQVIQPSSHFYFILKSFPTAESFGYFVVLLFFIINLLISIVDYFHSLQIKKVLRDITFRFGQTNFQNVEKLDMSFFRRQEVGDYIYRLSDDVLAIGTLIQEGILPIISSSVFLIAIIIILGFINLKLTLISVLFLPFLAGGLYIYNQKIVRASKESESNNSTVFSFIQQVLVQLKTIQVYSQEEKEQTSYNQKMHASLSSDLRVHKLNFILSALVGILIAISYSIIIGLGIKAVFNGEITTGLLIVFIFYLDNLTTPLVSLIYAFSSLRESLVKLNRMRVFSNAENYALNAGRVKSITDTSIKFDHVKLISADKVPILEDISLEIPAGKLTVILGSSGSGKTSTVSLIPRLISRISGGSIYLGKYKIEEYDLEVLRDNISFLPQDNILFNDTIGNVISYGNTKATMDDIKHAAKLALASEFIDKYPDKYNFKVGEGGNYLSGGQRQRLILARSLIRDTKILIFDEPLSFLDLKTRALVWKNIQNYTRGRTCVIVTNVLDVITDADHIIVLDQGTVIQQGTFKDLLKENKLYNFIIKE